MPWSIVAQSKERAYAAARGLVLCDDITRSLRALSRLLACRVEPGELSIRLSHRLAWFVLFTLVYNRDSYSEVVAFCLGGGIEESMTEGAGIEGLE